LDKLASFILYFFNLGKQKQIK